MGIHCIMEDRSMFFIPHEIPKGLKGPFKECHYIFFASGTNGAQEALKNVQIQLFSRENLNVLSFLFLDTFSRCCVYFHRNAFSCPEAKTAPR